MTLDIEDAIVFAKEFVRECERAEFYMFKASEPAERFRNLAECFLKSVEKEE